MERISVLFDSGWEIYLYLLVGILGHSNEITRIVCFFFLLYTLLNATKQKRKLQLFCQSVLQFFQQAFVKQIIILILVCSFNSNANYELFLKKTLQRTMPNTIFALIFKINRQEFHRIFHIPWSLLKRQLAPVGTRQDHIIISEVEQWQRLFKCIQRVLLPCISNLFMLN